MAERLHNHHILFHRKQHEATEDNKFIRRKTGLIVPLPLDVHDDLHRNTPGVPVIDIYMARGVKSIMLSQGIASDPLINIDNYCFAIAEACKAPNGYDLERKVGEVAIEAVRMQIPYIEEGVVRDETYLLDLN